MAAPELVVRVSANLDALRADLRNGEATIQTTKSNLVQMVNAFDGSRVISQAGAMVAAVHDLGGASKLTAAEQVRVNSLLGEAIEKYRALGGVAPPSMTRLANETAVVSNRMTQLQGGLSQVDRVLASMGINIGPQVAALRELSEVSGQTASQLGLVATAGLALAAGAAGWQIGTLIADYTGADEALGGWLARILGWSPAAQEAAAVTDVLARASANAGREITNYSEAIRINDEATRQRQASMIDFAQMLSTAKARLAELTDEDMRQFEAAKQLGATQEQLKVKFNLSATELQLLNQRLQENKAAQAEAEAEMKKYTDAVAEINSSGATWRETVAGINTAVAEQVKTYLEAGVSQSSLATVYSLTTTQVKALSMAVQEEARAHREAEQAAVQAARARDAALGQSRQLWEQYVASIRSSDLSTHNDRMVNVDEWMQKMIFSAVEAGTYTKEFYNQIAAAAEQMKQSQLVNMDEIRQHSKTAAQEQATEAQATYEYVKARASEFTQEFIELKRREAEAAQASVASWGQAATETFTIIRSTAAETTNAITESSRTAALSWMEAMTLVSQGKGTMTMTVAQRPIDKTPWGLAGSAPGTTMAPRWGTVNGAAQVAARAPEPIYARESFSPSYGGGGSGSIEINIASGAFVFNYPVLNDRRGVDELVRVVSEGVIDKVRNSIRLPLRS